MNNKNKNKNLILILILIPIVITIIKPLVIVIVILVILTLYITVHSMNQLPVHNFYNNSNKYVIAYQIQQNNHNKIEKDNQIQLN